VQKAKQKSLSSKTRTETKTNEHHHYLKSSKPRGCMIHSKPHHKKIEANGFQSQHKAIEERKEIKRMKYLRLSLA